jgi:thiamine biosynthesis lipoprotein
MSACRAHRGTILWRPRLCNAKSFTIVNRECLEFSRGGLATSGDTHRFLQRNGRRYSHILDVRTGWPVPEVPRSVTVAAASCVEAGMLATFAMLNGRAAEDFLEAQGVRYWSLR